MSFARLEYLPFLVLVALALPFLPRAARVAGMLAASYAFYAFAEPAYLALLLASTLLDFGVGLALGRTERTRARRAWLALSLVGNLGLLSIFKYAGMFARTVDALAGASIPVPDWALPLGISFYTFQTVGYTLDVYHRRVEPCRNPLEYGLYVSFFPQLVAGPIESAGHLLPQLRRLQPVGLANLSRGARLVLWGLGKKLVVADRFRPSLIERLEHPERHDSLTLLFTGIALNAVLYLDFSAYTDIARGSARLFGVDLVQNFRAPFLATSTSEYMRRWHMSLMHWIEEHLYVPLMRGRLSHRRIWGVNVLLMTLFALWHGAFGHYVVIGGILGVVVSAEQSRRLALARRGERRPRGAWRALLGWAGVTLLWSSFVVGLFSPDLEHMTGYLRGVAALRAPDTAALQFMGVGVLLLFAGLAVQWIAERFDLAAAWERMPLPVRAGVFAAAAWCVVKFGASAPQDFVYFRF